MLQTIFVLLTIVLIVGFTGCELTSPEVTEDELTEDSRRFGSQGPRKPSRTEFTASIQLQQVPDSVVTVQIGDTNRYKTKKEQLIGVVLSSDWEVLAGASIIMDNKTDFTLLPIVEGAYAGTYDISGKDSCTIKIMKDDKVIMRMRASGTIEGNMPCGAALEMDWRTIGKPTYGRASGSLSGTFVWPPFADPAVGIIALSGSYNN